MEILKPISDIQKTGNEAVKRLRRQKLSNGQPFMINSRYLPRGHSYIEFPDGHIELVSLVDAKNDFFTIKKLTSAESLHIRRQYHLLD